MLRQCNLGNIVAADLNWRAKRLLDKRERSRAIDVLREAVRWNAKIFWSNLMLADQLVSQNRYGEATRYYRNAIRLRPDDAIAHKNLGAVL